MVPIINYMQIFFTGMKTAFRNISFSKKLAVLIQAIGIFCPMALFILFFYCQNKIPDNLQSYPFRFCFIWDIANTINILSERIQQRYQFIEILKKLKYAYFIWFMLWATYLVYSIITYEPVSEDDLHEVILIALGVFTTIPFVALTFCFAKPASYKREFVVFIGTAMVSVFSYLLI